MATGDFLLCDGCGQAASAEHTAARLKRLEWATRFRPVHIQALLLGAAMPKRAEEFLYAPDGAFAGEAAQLLNAAGIVADGRTKEVVQAEVQRMGLFATYMLECPFDASANDGERIATLLERRLPAVLARIRRSLKPKKLVLISRALGPLAARFVSEAGCEVVLNAGKAFDLAESDASGLSRALQDATAARRGA